MGIKGLMKFLMDAAPKAVKEVGSPQAYTGRLMAIDASMCLYQFMISIRESSSGSYGNLTNEEGQVTSHIIGMLSRTVKMMENGIKPVYVFDGKPPELKLGELAMRREKRKDAEEKLAVAVETGDQVQILKSTKMTTRVTKEQNEQVKTLLRLMGVPVVEAPSEAEATCAALCRDDKVFAAATEDADCLTFGTKVLVRNLMAAESQKKQIYEVLPLPSSCWFNTVRWKRCSRRSNRTRFQRILTIKLHGTSSVSVSQWTLKTSSLNSRNPILRV